METFNSIAWNLEEHSLEQHLTSRLSVLVAETLNIEFLNIEQQ